MQELVRTNDFVRLSWLQALLASAGIEVVVRCFAIKLKSDVGNAASSRFLSGSRGFACMSLAFYRGKPPLAPVEHCD